MSDQYLLRLKRARFNYEEEKHQKVFNIRTLTEGTLWNPLCWNSPRTTAPTMEKTPRHQNDDSSTVDDQDQSRRSETVRNVASPWLNDELSEVGGRVRLYSESQVYTVSRWEDESQDGASAEDGGAGDGAPFRGRSQSAPAALWKAKKYGRQLRRMSDEFDTWLDKGETRRVNSPGKQTNRGWFSFLWGPKEEEGRE